MTAGIQLIEPLFERHFTVSELASAWSLSEESIKRMFQKEPGVLAMHAPRKKYKRTYVTLRIPQSVAERVYRRMQIAA
jgi:transcriptional regulator GlxA family with amidase domain